MSKYPQLDVLYKMGSEGAKFYERDPNYQDQEAGEEKLIMQTGASAYNFSDFDGIELVDTTGAGDSFTGAYAVAILEGMPQK